MTRFGFLALSLLFVTGCATEPEKKVAENQGEVCVREYKVGSLIPVVNCAPPQTEEERQRMINDARDMTRARPGNKPAGAPG